MQAVLGAILAAGEGTRLRPLTARVPKPLVPVAGRPLLEYGLDALARLGIEEVGINAFHLGDALPKALGHRREALRFVFEESLQGTGGGLRGIAAVLPRGTLVVINGDALFDFDLAPILARHRARGAMGTLVLRAVPSSAGFGRVGIDARGRLRRIAEIEGPGADRVTLSIGAYTGVQIVEPELVDAIPATGACDILRSAWRQRLGEGAALYGDFVAPDGVWVDVGTAERYREAHRVFLDGALPGGHLPAADAAGRRVDPAAVVAPDATLVGPCAVLAGARIGAGAVVGPYAFVDRDAEVAAGSRVVDAVVWAGAKAAGVVEGAVVM
ncbi:MAG: NDP-sugar synthase [Myxococcales bacterium]|nr:NDP-sugar synthase [Myxococcales bacterium]